MKIALLILFALVFSSCTEEKIIYIEKDSEKVTPEGRWDIEGFWYKHESYTIKYYDLDSVLISDYYSFYDTLESATDIIDFYYDYSSQDYQTSKFIFKCSDSTFIFSNNSRYPFVINLGSSPMRESFTLFNHFIDYDNFTKTSTTLDLQIGLKSIVNDGVSPFKEDNENCFINFTALDKVSKNGTTTYTRYYFEANGKRIK